MGTKGQFSPTISFDVANQAATPLKQKLGRRATCLGQSGPIYRPCALLRTLVAPKGARIKKVVCAAISPTLHGALAMIKPI